MTTSRDLSDDDQFTVPKEVEERAKMLTKAGVLISLNPKEVVNVMQTLDLALNGDSNDDEHDALYWVREWLSKAYEDPARRNKVG